MSQYRCAICGSPNVQRNESSNGFSYKKALVGTAVFGTVGAVAGINGKQTIQYTCPDCGFTKSAPMNDIEKTFIDSLMKMDGQLQSKFQSYFDRYAYLQKERINIASSNADATIAGTMDQSGAAKASEYTLEQVRRAIEDFHEAFDKSPLLCSVDPLVWKQNPIQDISVYEKGFEALSVIANGLYAYPQLIIDDDRSPFSRKSVRRAFLAHILLINGAMTCEEIYKAAHQHPYWGKTMDAILDQKKFQEKMQPRKLSITGELFIPKKDSTYVDVFFDVFGINEFLNEECNKDGYIGIEADEPISWDSLVGMHQTTISNNCYLGRLFNYAPGYEINMGKTMKASKNMGMGKSLYEISDKNKKIEFGYKMSNGSLYVAAVDALKIFDQENPETDQKIMELSAQYKEKEDQYYKNGPNKGLNDKITSLTEEAKQLRAKLFGKKKNEELAQEKEREIQKIKEQIAENSRKHSEETKKIDQEIEFLKMKRTEYLKSVDRWVCIAGPDCTIIPEEKSPTEEEIEKIKNGAARNWSLEDISVTAKTSIDTVCKVLGLPVKEKAKEVTYSKEEEKASSEDDQAKQPVQVFSSADEIRKFKELLDSGIITQEEFDAKKKQLLGL